MVTPVTSKRFNRRYRHQRCTTIFDTTEHQYNPRTISNERFGAGMSSSRGVVYGVVYSVPRPQSYRHHRYWYAARNVSKITITRAGYS